MKRLMLVSTAMILSATMSFAAVTANELVSAYQAQGYTRVEVKTGPTQIKVEAVKGTTKVEVIYDAVSGAILKQETQRARRGDRGNGVEYATEPDDFFGEDDSNGDDDYGDDDHGSDDDGSDNDDGDDDHGDDDQGSGEGNGHGKGGSGKAD